MRLLLPARIGRLKLRPAKAGADQAVARERLPKKPRRIRPGKAVLGVIVVAGVSIATSGPAHAEIRYAPTPKLPAISASTLGLRYALNRDALQQAATEAELG